MDHRPLFIALLQTTAIFITGFIIPVVGQVIALFTPVPLIILSVRSGRLQGLAALAAVSILVGFLIGWQAAAILFFTFGLMAIGISEGMHRRWRPELAILLGGIAPVIAAGLTALFYLSQIDKNPIAAAEEHLRFSMSEAAKLYTQLGLTETASKVASVSDKFIYYLVRLIPGIVITTSALQAACCYGLSRILIARRPDAPAEMMKTSLDRWYAPDFWVWGLIGALVLIMVPQEPARLIGWNLSMLFAVVYLAQGIALMEHYLRKGRIQPFIRALIYAIILALPSIVFVIALGVVDIWADFRKVRALPQNG